MTKAEFFLAAWPATPSLAFIRRIQADACRADAEILRLQISLGHTRSPRADALSLIEKQIYDLVKADPTNRLPAAGPPVPASAAASPVPAPSAE